jgi:TolA-binding protein
MNPQKKLNSMALLLIAVALAGAGVSYHFTLESRFATIEQKLDQNALALQQFQATQESTMTSKMDALNSLSKEVDALQALGKTTHDQSDSLMEMHKQITALEQSQQAQIDAQKKLADYAQQLDKMKHAVQAPSTPPQVPIAPVNAVVTTPPAPAPAPAPILQPRTTMSVPLPLPPRADNAVDLRPDQSTIVARDLSVRALPVALPVADAR